MTYDTDLLAIRLSRDSIWRVSCHMTCLWYAEIVHWQWYVSFEVLHMGSYDISRAIWRVSDTTPLFRNTWSFPGHCLVSLETLPTDTSGVLARYCECLGSLSRESPLGLLSCLSQCETPLGWLWDTVTSHNNPTITRLSWLVGLNHGTWQWDNRIESWHMSMT